MKKIKNSLLFIVVLICVFIGWWTAQDNTEVIPVYLLGFQLPALSVGVWLVAMLLAGALLGMLASLPLIIRYRSDNRRLKRNQLG